ncbi:hypothetical protein VTI28DRAFT_8435 [Corynascus sepedonium]
MRLRLWVITVEQILKIGIRLLLHSAEQNHFKALDKAKPQLFLQTRKMVGVLFPQPPKGCTTTGNKTKRKVITKWK